MLATNIILIISKRVVVSNIVIVVIAVLESFTILSLSLATFLCMAQRK